MRLIGLFLALGLTLAPFAAEAQQVTSSARVGFLSPTSLSDPRTTRFLESFRQGLRELGHIEGQNIAIEYRWAEGKYERLPGLAAQLVRRRKAVQVRWNNLNKAQRAALARKAALAR